MAKARPSQASGKSGKAGKAKSRPAGQAKPRRAKTQATPTAQARGPGVRPPISAPKTVRVEKEIQANAIPEMPPPLPAPIASFTF
jgi:hypothetical protein